MALFSEASSYIRGLQKSDGRPLIYSKLKTGFIGFLSGISAMKDLYEETVVCGPMSFILTYKFSQDHLEMFFGTVRSHLGANNNPSCKEFISIIKRLMVHNEIRAVKGNVDILDSTEFLTISSKQWKPSTSQSTKMLLLSDIDLKKNEVYEVENLLNGLSEFKEAVITYIAGYVVKMVKKNVKCEDCLASLLGWSESPTKRHQLFSRKKWGHLTLASNDVIEVCLQTETELMVQLIQEKDMLLDDGLLQKLSIIVLKKVFLRRD